MRIAWATDIHLNFLGPQERALFFQSMVDVQPDAVVVTGDIAEAPSLTFHLEEMYQALHRPLYFVLGNHDFYFGSIEQVRHRLEEWSRGFDSLKYLSREPALELTPTTVLVGVDGWGDGRFGDYWGSPVRLSDQECIQDFQGLDREGVLRTLRALGDAEAECLRTRVKQVVPSYPRVLLLTHVPPFKEACWYEGKVGNDDWLPYFTCQAVGEVLLETAKDYPRSEITVLCGHTHHAGMIKMCSNLTVITGSAEYGYPHLEQVFQVE